MYLQSVHGSSLQVTTSIKLRLREVYQSTFFATQQPSLSQNINSQKKKKLDYFFRSMRPWEKGLHKLVCGNLQGFIKMAAGHSSWLLKAERGGIHLIMRREIGWQKEEMSQEVKTLWESGMDFKDLSQNLRTLWGDLTLDSCPELGPLCLSLYYTIYISLHNM